MDIKEKIAALLAKAKRTDNEHEAEAFLAKVQSLLVKHQLEIGDVLAGNDPILKSSGLKMAASGHKWTRELYRALGHLYGCKSCLLETWEIAEGEWSKVFEQQLVGRESSLATVAAMYPWVAAEVRRHGARVAQETGMSPQGQAKRVGAALITRIWRMVGENEAADAGHPTEAASHNALVTIDLVQAAFDGFYPKRKVLTNTRSLISDRMSREAAGSIGLDRQVSGTGQLRLSVE